MMHLGGDYWARYFSEIFVVETDLFRERMSCSLPTEEEMSSKAKRAEDEKMARLVAAFQYRDDVDESELADTAFQHGVAIYSSMGHLRQGLINLFAVGLFHLFEQHLFLFYRRGLQWGFRGRLIIKTVQSHLRTEYNIDISSFESWPDIVI